MKIVILSGAGISANSGIPTYRSSDGLWANYKIEEVCTPEALARDRAKVVNFYNMRRQEMAGKSPNAGHKALVKLEKYFDVEIVTQNIDNLHEAAGSTKITHLHGELTKLRTDSSDYIVDIGPGAGIHGGEIVAAGTPEEVAVAANSVTGEYLKPLLNIK